MLTAIFGPVSSSYCFLFYVIGVWSLVGAALMGLSLVIHVGFSKKIDPAVVYTILYATALNGMLYLQNRILYSMCRTSIRESFSMPFFGGNGFPTAPAPRTQPIHHPLR